MHGFIDVTASLRVQAPTTQDQAGTARNVGCDISFRATFGREYRRVGSAHWLAGAACPHSTILRALSRINPSAVHQVARAVVRQTERQRTRASFLLRTVAVFQLALQRSAHARPDTIIAVQLRSAILTVVSRIDGADGRTRNRRIAPSSDGCGTTRPNGLRRLRHST